MRDADMSVAYTAIDAVSNTPDATSSLSSLVRNSSMSYQLRWHAANALRGIGRMDSPTKAMVEAFEASIPSDTNLYDY